MTVARDGIDRVAEQARERLIPLSGTVTGPGEFQILPDPLDLTILAIKRRIRLHYCSYNPLGTSKCGFRFYDLTSTITYLDTPPIFFYNEIVAYSIFAKDLRFPYTLEGDSFWVNPGPTPFTEPLNIVVNAAVVVNWNILYTYLVDGQD